MIEAINLVKNYGSAKIIKDVSFSLEPGTILGFLGPNGAGKTTIMRMLAGCNFPDSGTVKINGVSLDEENSALKNNIGYLPETAPLYPDMTVREYLLFAASLRLIPKPDRPDAVKKVMDLCGVSKRQNQRIETLSHGYRQRLGLAQAFIHDPQILILDEPMTGLDPNQIIEFRRIIKEMGKKKIVIFSTHIIQEVLSVCTSYLVLDNGSIAAQGSTGGSSRTNLEKIFAGLNQKENP
ncbi:MAG: ABC transporter ATP-binding protein [Treponema sp.]|nr:ABC transporter ATP-binding protein [Treponema sp.]